MKDNGCAASNAGRSCSVPTCLSTRRTECPSCAKDRCAAKGHVLAPILVLKGLIGLGSWLVNLLLGQVSGKVAASFRISGFGGVLLAGAFLGGQLYLVAFYRTVRDIGYHGEAAVKPSRCAPLATTQEECPKRRVPCDLCGRDIIVEKLNAHKLRCPKRKRRCKRCTKETG